MIKNLDSILLYVKDPKATAEFYKALGFEITRDTDDSCVAKLAEFEIHAHNEAAVEFKQDPSLKKGVGVFVYVETEDIDGYHKGLQDKGLRPSSEPKDWPWGNREFAIKDPDGYVLVFYQTLKAS